MRAWRDATTPGRMQKALIDFLDGAWQHPDDGIWEVRGAAAALHALEGHGLGRRSTARTSDRRARSAIGGPRRRAGGAAGADPRRGVRPGFDAKRGHVHAVLRVARPGRSAAGDSARRLPARAEIRGWSARSPRSKRGLLRDGFVLRYETRPAGPTGFRGGEGAFLACSFWLADELRLHRPARRGRALFERLLGLRNDLGPLAEEYDPSSGDRSATFRRRSATSALVNTAVGVSTWPARPSWIPPTHDDESITTHPRSARRDSWLRPGLAVAHRIDGW